MKKGLSLVFLTILGLSVIFAAEQSVLIKSFAGKVEYRSGTEAWKPVAEGMKLPFGATVSTGFDSRAVLEIDTATLSVAPLTRMAIKDLVEKNGVVSTGVYLQVGKIKTQVKKVEGIQNDFVIKSPVTTASVRGTIFDFDSVNIGVEEGIVLMTDQYTLSRRVYANESSKGRYGTSIYAGSEARDDALSVSWLTTDLSGPQSGNEEITGKDATSGEGPQFGSVTIKWQYTPTPE